VSAVREALFDAADALLRRASWSSVSMAVLAAHAGVSRQTLYNEFGTRDEFAQAWVVREAERFVAKFESAFDGHRDPRLALRRAFIVFLREAAVNPTVRQILGAEAGSSELLALFTTKGGPVLELATARVARKLRERWPRTTAARARAGAECLVRLAISHATLASGPPAASARAVADVVAGYVVRD